MSESTGNTAILRDKLESEVVLDSNRVQAVLSMASGRQLRHRRWRQVWRGAASLAAMLLVAVVGFWNDRESESASELAVLSLFQSEDAVEVQSPAEKLMAWQDAPYLELAQNSNLPTIMGEESMLIE